MKCFVFAAAYVAILIQSSWCNAQIKADTNPLVSIVVLGNAQDAGYPQAGCNQQCCLPAWKDPARKRMASCIAVLDLENKKRLLLDCTPNFPDQLRLLDEKCLELGFFNGQIPAKTKLDAIFLTHAHIGHYTLA